MNDLTGKVALITGAAGKRGLGRASALCLAKEGANIVVSDLCPISHEYDREVGWPGLDGVVEEVEALGCQALAVIADVSVSQQVNEMVQKALERFGKIDILVNNAGTHGARGVHVIDTEEEVWNKTMAVNLTGPFLCCKAVAKGMVERGEGGKIINISSITGKMPLAGRAEYAASKAGLIALTQALALELAPHKINVNAICPGAIDTDAMDGYVRSEAKRQGISIDEAKQQFSAAFAPISPLGRKGQPEEVGNMVAFLVSSKSDYITGQSLLVTGGWGMF